MDDLLQRLASALADRYRIESEIGSGGMALVYLATDLKHDRRVALKVMRPQLAHAIGTDRFLSEIQIMARLDHPHIVPLLDSGETRGFLYFVMPYVAGETLRERLQRDERLPVDEVLRLTRELASALDYAHEQGVVHRDIKPANIFMQSGHARLADFGIAHAAGEAGGERLTATGMSVGTPAYMSPEQAGGDRDVDTRSDIYSLACVTYEMLSGTPPFAGSNSRVVLAKHLNEEAPDITAVRPEAGRLAASALAKALQKLPKDRQATTGEYADDLERGAKVPRRRKRRVGRTAAALAVVALATVMAWIGSRGAAETDAGDPAEAKVPIDPNLIAVFPLRVAFPDTSLERLEANVGAVLEVLFDGETGPRAAEPFMVRRAWEELTENGAITPTDEELRWTAADLGYGQMLTGTVSGSGSLVQVVARIEGTVDGRELGKASIRAPSHPDSMYRIIDELGIRLAGLNAGEPEERMRHLLGSSAEAREAYVTATRARRAGDYRGARLKYEEALRKDSTFALAALGLVNLTGWLPPQDREDSIWLDAMRIAWSHRSRLTRVDSLIQAGHGGAAAIDPRESDVAQQMAAWRAAVALAPSHYDALNGLGDRILHKGALVDVPHHADSAWRYLVRAFESDTLWGTAHGEVMNHLVDLAIARRDTEALRRFMPPLRRAGAGGGFSHELFAAHVLGDSAVVDSIRRRLEADPKQRGAWTLINEASLLRAAYDEADYIDSEAEESWQPDLRYKWSLVRGRPTAALSYAADRMPDSELLLDALYSSGDGEAAEETATRLYAEISDTTPVRSFAGVATDACRLAQWHLAQGDPEGAERIIQFLRRVDLPAPLPIGIEDVAARKLPTDEQQRAVDRTMLDLCITTMSAWHAVWADSVHARERLDSADHRLRRGVVWWPAHDYLRRLNLALARAWELAGEPERALQAVRRRLGFLRIDRYLAESLRDEGRLAAAVGDTAGAIYAYEYYLELRSDPEPELLPEVAEVRAALEALR